MYNFVDVIIADPVRNRQFRSGEHLMAEFTCPLKTAEQDMWSHASYFVTDSTHKRNRIDRQDD